MPYLCYAPQVKKARRLRKIVDETTQVRCALGKGLIREEVWQDSRGAIAKYNLAFINHDLCARDNGGWWATTTATVIIIGISPAPKRSSPLSATKACWNDFSTKCGNSAKRRSRYEVEDQYGWI